MPLRGKIVVIKRSGGDGTEFPLTASCLFGRKPDCDIRIQLPQVSKEHCRIDLNENKEVVLTNLSSVNPTRVNGEVLQQSERLKHGDVITIIDRSFRFEYPPAATPKKRSSTGGKVLQDQQLGETVGVETVEKRIPELSTDPHLKDGTNHENIQRSLEKTVEMESKEDDSLLQNKTASPFSDLYQMIKKSLDVSTPRKSCASLLQTPTSRFCTPKPVSVRKNVSKPVINTEDESAPKKDQVEDVSNNESKGHADVLCNGTPKSVKKQRRSFQVSTAEAVESEAKEDEHSKSETTLPQTRKRSSPQRFTACEVIDHLPAPTFKSPPRRSSREVTPAKLAVTEPLKKSPRNSGKVTESKKRKSGDLAADLPTQQTKRKRVSFGGYLAPELFDKRLPPDSPLRKGATPRRSLGLAKPKDSLLRRASVIGYLKTPKQAKKSPKSKTPSPKAASPAKKSPKSKTPSPKAASPAKKSPKSKTPSPKAASPAKKSPKSKTPSPKAASSAKKSPKSKTPSPKAASSAKKSPKSKTPSPKAASPAKKSPKSPAPKKTPQAAGTTPARTPLCSGIQTPTVQGCFSVSRISTPSPVTEDSVSDLLPSLAVTPKIFLRRKSMKSTSQKTPKVTKSAVKVMRRSGISRASMKVINSWADIVKFGQTKTQVAAPTRKIVTKKATKKTVSKPQTPARKLKGLVSTGHADSPVSIVVGKAYKQKFVQPSGAAPRVATNIALLKKDMKMDEDLTGVSEMFKTPTNERKRRSVISDSAAKTPVGSLGSAVVEQSVLNTPEEPGEMIVSPLSVASTKGKAYNSEAVQRLLELDAESSFVSEVPASRVTDDSSEQETQDLEQTPKQKPQKAECLTGIKRIMKTPKQKAEAVEDLRGKLLKTPKQKVEQPECLTGVKRIMKTPRQKAEPVEDLRGRLLKTPIQKPEQQECLTGVKRIMKTPKQKAEPVEDLRGKLFVTPVQKPPQQECLTGVKRIMTTPKGLEVDDVEEVLQATTQSEESKAPAEVADVKQQPTMSLPQRERSAPVEEMVGVGRVMKTPREKSKPVEEFFGLKRLMKSPRLRGNAPVEDFEGLQELMMEPLTESPGQTESSEVEEPLDSLLSNVPGVEMTKAAEEAVNPGEDAMESSSPVATVSLVGEPTVNLVDCLSIEHPDVTVKVKETGSNQEKKSLQGRRGKVVKSKATEDKREAPEDSEDTVVPAPVRGRRGKKAETTAPPAVRQTTRNRSKDVELTMEDTAPKSAVEVSRPTRGRNAKTAVVQEVQVVATEKESVQAAESEECVSVSVDLKAAEEAPSTKKTTAKARRGKNTKEPEQKDVPLADDANADQVEVVSSEGSENEILSQVEKATCAEVDAGVQKKPGRGKRAKIVESKVTEDENSEEPAIPAPIRARRGRKAEAPAAPAARQTRKSKKAQESAAGQAEAMHENEVETSAEDEGDRPLVAVAQCQQLDTVEKPRRGRKMQPGAAEPKEGAEDKVVTAETKQEMPVSRARRGRNAKQDESSSGENAEPEKPVSKSRKTRKTEQDHVEPVEEVQTSESVLDVPDAQLVAEPVKLNQQSAVAANPRRGGRKTRQAAESEPPVESAVAQEVSVSAVEKPKRAAKGKRPMEEAAVPAEELKNQHDQELKSEETATSEPVIKSSRTRAVKTEASQTIPAKRARRGAAAEMQESHAESTAPISDSVEPAKRSRRGAAKPTDDKAAMSDEANPSEDVSPAVVEDTKRTNRSVKWKTELEVFEVPKPTPVKAVRGRKSKVEAENKSTEVNKPEEKNLSDNTEEAQPAKRARRGAKATEVTESSSKKDPKKDAAAETQPTTRRGRAARK